LIETLWSPNPSLKMLKELGFMQCWKGGSEPDSCGDIEANQFLLERVQSSPPQTTNSDFVAMSRLNTLGKSFAKVGEVG
jgi:hypothetical protein